MNQNKNNNILSIMETPPMRIELDVSQHPVDKADPIFRLKKSVDELAVTVNSILRKAGVR